MLSLSAPFPYGILGGYELDEARSLVCFGPCELCAEEGRDGYNVNASGRRCASTVFIMIVSGVILYLVYGVGARDLGERLEARERRRRRVAKLTGLFKKEPAAVAAEAEEAAVAAAVPDEPGEKL